MERAAELSPDPGDQARRLVAAASAAVSTGQADWVGDPASRALAVTADPELRLTARHDAGWALAYSGRRTAALPALISVAEEASRDLPDLAWDALADAATVAYQSGTPASRQAVSRVLGLLEHQEPRSAGHGPRADTGSHRFWIQACTDPFGSRNELLRYLRQISGSPIEEPSLWRIGPAACSWTNPSWRSLAAGRHAAAPGPRHAGHQRPRPDRARVGLHRHRTLGRGAKVAAEAADLAEANQMELVAAAADLITATVLAMRADSGAARRHADRALATVDPAECGQVAARARRALGVAALADGSHLLAFTQLRGLFSEDGTPVHNYFSYLGVADIAAAAVRADRRMEGQDVLERALSHLDGTASPGSSSSSPGARHPRRPGRGRSPLRQGTRRSRRGPVAIRAGPASPRLRRMATAAPPDQRRQTRPDRSPGNLPATRRPVMGAAGGGRAESVRGSCHRPPRRTRCPRGAHPRGRSPRKSPCPGPLRPATARSPPRRQ